MKHEWTGLALIAMALGAACGNDDDAGVEADRLLVGAECSTDDDCLTKRNDGFSEKCLTQFKGGYCGIENCASNSDCPERSACVRHEDDSNYCFRLCVDKPECNANRTDESALSNCSSSIEYVDGAKAENGKACVPPS